MSNLLTLHDVIRAENELLKVQMKYQASTRKSDDSLAEKYVLEIVKLNKEVNKRKAKMKKEVK